MRGVALLFLLSAAACGSVSGSKVDAAVTGDAAPDGPAIDAPPPECPIGVTAFCDGDNLVTCDGQGNITATSPCLLGCDTGQNRCTRIAPSNGLAQHLDDAATAPDLAFSGAATIDTSSGTIVDQSGARVLPTVTLTGGPVEVFVIKVKSLTTGGTVTVTGTRALAIVADGPVAIDHVVNLSAVAATPGPGAHPNDATGRGKDAGASNTEGRAGGGGGGFGSAGGAGGTGGNPLIAGGLAGAVTGNSELVPLRGGTPGGRPSSPSANYAPGQGGGALQIVSNVAINLGAGGAISANGTGGRRTATTLVLCATDSPCGNGEGGGSGGGILLEAPALTMDATAGIYANGGGGSCSVFSGAGGSGANNTTPAAGQVCEGQTGSGGNGSAGLTNAQQGVNRSGNDSVGGGGGGGRGRVRINLPAGATFTPAGTISAVQSVGALATR